MVVRARLGAGCPTQWLQCWWVGRGLQGCDSGQNVMVSFQGPGAITDWNFNVLFFFFKGHLNSASGRAWLAPG